MIDESVEDVLAKHYRERAKRSRCVSSSTPTSCSPRFCLRWVMMLCTVWRRADFRR
jgi:hypothetical protein